MTNDERLESSEGRVCTAKHEGILRRAEMYGKTDSLGHCLYNYPDRIPSVPRALPRGFPRTLTEMNFVRLSSGETDLGCEFSIFGRKQLPRHISEREFSKTTFSPKKSD